MTEREDFERAWLTKFSDGLDRIAGKETRAQVMQGSEGLSSQSHPQEVIAWSRAAMARLEASVDEQKCREIMTRCACQYPKAHLQAIRQVYQTTGDVDRAQAMLQQQFETLLRDTLKLSEEMIAEIVGRGWGSAGVRQGDTIIATKIPKSGYLLQYMQETDPEKRRQCYCHCPRIREVLKTSETLPAIYCYCGAGFYQGIWEEITRPPVEVEVLESVLRGDQVCQVAIHLPPAP